MNIIEPAFLHGKDVLPFWKWGIPSLAQVLRQWENRPVLAPMESSACSFLSPVGQFFPPDSLLSQAEINASITKAVHLIRMWVQECGPDSWAPYLQRMLQEPVASIFIAAKMGEKFLSVGIRRLYCLEASHFSTNLQWFNPDFPILVWKDMLPGIYQGIPVAEAPSRNPAERPFPPEALEYERLAGAALFVMYARDIYRYRKIIKKIMTRSSIPSVIVLYNGTREDYEEAQKTYEVPVLRWPGGMNVELAAEAFLPPIRLGAFFPRYPKTSALLMDALNSRIINYERLYKNLMHILHRHKPKVAFVSYGLADGFRIIEKSLNNLSIPIYNLMHGNAIFEPRTPYLDKTTLIMPYILSKKIMKNNNAKIKILTHKDMEMHDGYKMDKIIHIDKNQNLILFIQSISQLFPSLFYYDALDKRIKILKNVLTIPEKLSKHNIIVRYKSHPTWNEPEISHMAGVEEIFLPLDANLDHLLEQSAVVVCLNYDGSPALQAVQQQVPVILMNTMYAEEAPRYYSSLGEYMVKAGCLHTNEPDQTWALIQRLLEEPDFRQQVVAAQNEQIGRFLTAEHSDWKILDHLLA